MGSPTPVAVKPEITADVNLTEAEMEYMMNSSAAAANDGNPIASSIRTKLSLLLTALKQS